VAPRRQGMARNLIKSIWKRFGKAVSREAAKAAKQNHPAIPDGPILISGRRKNR
jgi:hypothetical protein